MRTYLFRVSHGLVLLSTWLLLLILVTEAPVSAHVEKGAMPDSVAEMEYRIVLEFTPQDTATRYLLGMALLRQNKLAEAEKELRRILESDPKNFDALAGLGLVLFKQKRGGAALPYLLNATKIRPNDIMVHLHLGLTLAAEGQTEAARQALTTGLELTNKQATSSTRDHHQAEFKAALATLSRKTGAPAHQ